jgi:hypothetical protein
VTITASAGRKKVRSQPTGLSRLEGDASDSTSRSQPVSSELFQSVTGWQLKRDVVE